MRVAFTRSGHFIVEEFDSLIYNNNTDEALFYNKDKKYSRCVCVKLDYDEYYRMAHDVLSCGYINLDGGYSYEPWR